MFEKLRSRLEKGTNASLFATLNDHVGLISAPSWKPVDESKIVNIRDLVFEFSKVVARHRQIRTDREFPSQLSSDFLQYFESIVW